MEWKEVRLGEVIDYKKGFAFKSSMYNSTGTYIVRISDTTANSVDVSLCNCISPELAQQYTDYSLKTKDIIIATVGSWPTNPASIVGKVVRVPESADNALLNQNAVRIRSNGLVDSDYLYYLLKEGHFSKYLVGTAQGSANQASITLKDIFGYSFSAPSTKEDQRRIASILSSLDRKIELNNKINADLEEMAQAIFKNWFVDFEPFKDGAFVDSELGMIPEGWKVGLLGELCNFKRGKNLLTKNAIDEGVPVVAGGLEPSCYHNEANTGAPVITVSGSGANAGFMRMYHVPVWASDCSFIDISCENFYFVYCFLNVNSKLLKHAQTGAVQPHVKPSDIHDFELVIPNKESIFDFQNKVKPFFDRIATIQKESSRLSLLRDTLLPRLMSGEIEIPE